MYYVVQENVFRDHHYNMLIEILQKSNLDFEIVQVFPFVEDIKFETKRTDVFPFGGLKLARLGRKYNWTPGSQMNDNHDFMVYKDHYKENLLNWNSKIIKFGDDFSQDERFFARPTKDTKAFTGKIFDMYEWDELKEYHLNNGHTSLLDKDTDVQICPIRKIYNEIRFWIVKGEIITASQYMLGNQITYNANVDDDAYEFCQKMVDIYQLNDAFVMDLAYTDNGYKIVECNCINCAGFYHADLQKLLMAIEDKL